MRTLLILNTEKLIKNLDSPKEFYEIRKDKNKLKITKKYINKRGRPFSANLPKEIKIHPSVLGLIVGEGFFGGRNFVFANSNERAIDLVLEFLKQFNLPVKIYLEISTKNKNSNFIKKCISFWEKHLKLKIKRVRLRKEFNNTSLNGTIHIGINNSLLARLLRQMILVSKKKVERNKDLAIDYLKGILAAEGNINVKRKTNCVYMVRISASKPEERKHYKRCLKKVGIKIYCKDMPTISAEDGIKLGWKTNKGRAGAVIVSKWDNFIKVLELNLLELCEDKKQKFMKYFLNNKFTKQFLDFALFINKEFTSKEAQNYFGFKGRYLNRLVTFCRKGYFSRKLKNNYYIYTINEKYFKIYDILSQYQNIPISR